jgi:hypothetical protein
MLRILLVSSVLSLVAVPCGRSSAFLAAERSCPPTALRLDLTKPRPREQQLTAVPGGGGSSSEAASLYVLPLSATLVSISPVIVQSGKHIAVQVLLENMGQTPFYLPASQSSASVLKQGNRSRRSILYALVLQDSTSRSMSFILGSSDGSDSIPTSFLRLDAGQSVCVSLSGEPSFIQSDISEWLARGIKQASARIQVFELDYEDGRYFIARMSRAVTSANFATVQVQ